MIKKRKNTGFKVLGKNAKRRLHHEQDQGRQKVIWDSLKNVK